MIFSKLRATNTLSTLITFEPPKYQRILFVLAAIILFLALPLWQSLRQPRIGDSDVVRLGLLLLNRYDQRTFSGDVAMQASQWWPGYTPVYLAILGIGYNIIGDASIVFVVLGMLAYINLLLGFYWFGRQLGLPFLLSLTLAYTSGLYFIAAKALAWTGVGTEMATPRNLYLGFLPWALGGSLWIYRLPKHQTRNWLLLGLVLGLLSNLHPVTGPVIIGILGLIMLIGVLYGRFRFLDLVVFSIGTLPGLIIVYSSVTAYANKGLNLDLLESDPGTSQAASSFIYNTVARANVFFYRIPNWEIPILIYSILTFFVGLLLVRAWRLHQRNLSGLWTVFGSIQFAAALLILTTDWWTLFVAIEWIRRTRNNTDSVHQRLTLLYLTAVNVLAFPVSAFFSVLGSSRLFLQGHSIARVLQRGGTLAHAALIIFSALFLWDILRNEQYQAKSLLILTAITTIVLGLYQPEFEIVSGSWLPFDLWVYLGVFLLAFWPRLNGDVLKAVLQGCIVMLLFQAVTRILAVPASNLTTLLMGIVVFAAIFTNSKLSLRGSKQALILLGIIVPAIIPLLPIAGPSTLERILTDTRRVFLRNWSRVDRWSYYTQFYYLGTWLRENTPEGSLIVTDLTYLRYWSLRPQTVSSDDYRFVSNPVRDTILQESKRVQAAYQSPEGLLSLSRASHANYVVIDKLRYPNLDLDDAAIVYNDATYTIYKVKGN